MEVLGAQPDTLKGTVHGPWPLPAHAVGAKLATGASLAAAYNVYGVRWSPRAVRFLFNGRSYETVTPADLPAGSTWPFDHPFFLLLDLAVGGAPLGPPLSLAEFPARLSVDWVRVWQVR
jgi:beta-glucanase (GH16 family)